MAASTRLGATMRDADNTAARRAALQAGARAQPEYDSSNFFASVLATSIDRRGVRAFAAPFAVVNAVSSAWTVIHERAATSAARADQGAFDGAYALTFSAMGVLLVFRLARAAVRWYDGRAAFGGIVAGVRAFVDVLLMYGGDDDRGRAAVDDGAAWACAFASASKCHLRGAREIERDEVAGILSDEDRVAVSRSKHPPLFCLSMCRRAVKRCFEGRGRDADAAALRYELNKSGFFGVASGRAGAVASDEDSGNLRHSFAHVFIRVFDIYAVRVRRSVGVGNDRRRRVRVVRVARNRRRGDGVRDSVFGDARQSLAHGPVRHGVFR